MQSCLPWYADTDHPLLLVRPFLELPKWQLEAACTEQGLTWADDPTNRNTAYLRNHLRALLSKPMPQPQAQSKHDCLERHSELSTQLSSLSLHQLPSLDEESQQPDKPYYINGMAADCSSDAACMGGIVPSVLQVQRRCAAAHNALSSAAKDLFQASLQLPARPRQRQQSQQRDPLAQQAVSDWTLAVKPFAEAHPDVALHALTAVMQVGGFSLSMHCWAMHSYAAVTCMLCQRFCLVACGPPKGMSCDHTVVVCGNCPPTTSCLRSPKIISTVSERNSL